MKAFLTLIAIGLWYLIAPARAEVLPIQSGFSPSILQVDDLRLVFTFRILRFSDGTAIKVYTLPQNHRTTKEFSTTYLGMTARRWWELLEAQEATGRKNLHRVVPDERAMYTAISSQANSVGFVDEYILVNDGGDGGIVVIERKPRH